MNPGSVPYLGDNHMRRSLLTILLLGIAVFLLFTEIPSETGARSTPVSGAGSPGGKTLELPVKAVTGDGGGGAASTLLVQEHSPSAGYSGGWHTVSRTFFSGGTAVAAMSPGDQATFTFTGVAVRWIAYRDEWSGIASIYLDGKLQATVDTYANPPIAQTSLWGASGLERATHTLTIVVQGSRNASSGGTWIWLDAFDVTP